MTYHLQQGDLHHALVEVSWLVLDNLHSNDFVRFDVLALDDLAKGALA